MKKSLFLLPLVAFLVFSCKSLLNAEKQSANKKEANADNTVTKKGPYQASKTREFDLIHTALEVAPIWEKQQLNGLATLTIKPHFYAQTALTLDAKSMEIKSVELLDTANLGKALSFKNDSLKLYITLDKKYTRKDTLKIKIKYIAKPNELNGKGSNAINDDKGLYFINPLGRDKVKPQQLWTQGETEASSCWFPTIDAPNEKTTQEIKITVDNEFKTLSNGLLISSTNNGDGTRTDYWKQAKPHAPYLFMMAVGKFAVVQDTWKGMQVNYLVEPKDTAYAKGVFGNTPEMLTFYSNLLGYEYPWDKYNQIVVSDYVSGAMENTGAVIHGKWVFTTPQQQVDRNHEDVIAHELFHHWFGDLVTCESWSNLPLNESFATYGEYLWIEHKYDQFTADRHLHLDLLNYFSDRPTKELIRFHYDDKEDMFDRHSYEKGGRVLHMLRNFVGDEAFFASLQLYLKTNEFKSVEIHQLRLAFEEVTGQDLNWFFNQWFLSKGHPVLDVNWVHQGDSLTLNVTQSQPEDEPIFSFPVEVDIYFGGKPVTKELWINERNHSFLFKGLGGAEAVNFDAKKGLLAQVRQTITADEALVLYTQGKNYRTKLDGLLAINNDTSMAAWEVLNKASKDTFEHFRKIAYYLWARIPEGQTEDHKAAMFNAFKTDSSAAVRLAIVSSLAKNWANDSSLIPFYKKALADTSVNVKLNALFALEEIAREDALLRAYGLEQATDPRIITSLADLYSDVRDESKRKWYAWAIKQVEAREKVYVINLYQKYLSSKGNEFVWLNCQNLKEEAIYENNKDVRTAAGLAIHQLRLRNMERIADIRKDITEKKASSKGKPYDLKLLEGKHEELLAHETRILKLLQEIVEKEINNGVKQAYEEAGILTTPLPDFKGQTATENEEKEDVKESK